MGNASCRDTATYHIHGIGGLIHGRDGLGAMRSQRVVNVTLNNKITNSNNFYLNLMNCDIIIDF